jgi:hypothetical protein
MAKSAKAHTAWLNESMRMRKTRKKGILKASSE